MLAENDGGAALRSVMPHATPIAGFVDALRSWADAVDAHKPEQCQLHVETLRIFAQLLSEDQEFRKIYRRNVDGCTQQDPAESMQCVYAFFNAVADASRPGHFRAQASAGAPHIEFQPPR